MGRPTKFDPEYVEQAYKLALLGATDKQMADFWGVTEKTVNNWKHEYPDFLQSLKAGKLSADATVVQSLYRRANGFDHSAVKIFMPAGAAAPVYADYTEKYPPDTTAAIFWLKNRQPELWRDKLETAAKVTLEPTESTPLELARGLAFVLALAQREAGATPGHPAPSPEATKH